MMGSRLMLALALVLCAACAARAELQLSSSTYNNADFVAETFFNGAGAKCRLEGNG